jgi:16S rRNA (cytosine967-C5)-methyltransferase
MPADEGLAPRRAALAILEQVRAGRPFDAALEQSLRPLPEPDRRLAHELAAGVLRRRSGLDARLEPLASRGWTSVPPTLQNILRLGAYQLTALDRVPAHAAVSTSVALAHEAGGARAGGFVNALLRRMTREPARPGKGRGVGPLDLAARYSHPEWLVRRWLERFGPEETERLLQWNNSRPSLVIQPARASGDAILRRLAAGGIRAAPAPWGAGIAVSASRPDQLPGFADGDFVVQDPAQALVTWFAGLPAGSRLYDACAAPGGKAIAIARMGVRVLAADLSRPRVARLRQNLRRAGGRVGVAVADARCPPVRSVDAVLLDAPCLGTGTFARHPDARWRVTPDALAALVRAQAELLTCASSVVRPDGLLVYATCSLEPEENEAQVDGFLETHSDFQREPPDDALPTLLTPKGDLMILPQRDRMDGAYAARLRRAA